MLNKNWYYLLFITAFVMLGYREIAFFQSSVVYDIMDAYYPWRYFISQCLQNHQLPLWEPYQHLGSPICANPQSGAWYPFVWLSSFIYGYDIYVAHIEVVFHLILAAFSFYLLLDYLKIDKKHAAIGGCVYVFSGFFIGHAQHISWLISAAWMPFVVRFYLISLEKLKLRNFIITALFIFLLLTGGYPAFTIVLIYVLIGIFIYQCVARKDTVLKMLGASSIISILAFLFSMVLVVSVVHNAPWLSRGSGLDFPKASLLPFTLQCWISFFTPYATTQDLLYYNTDISMSNAYFGVISIVIILYSLIYNRNKINIILSIVALLFFVLAHGNATPAYKIVYEILPGFSYFRGVSLLCYFGITALLIVSFRNLSYFMDENSRFKIITPSIIVVLGILAIVVYAYFGLSETNVPTLTTGRYNCMLKQGIFQIAMILALLVTLIYLNKSKFKLYIVGMLMLIDISYAARLNFQYTVYSGVPPSIIKSDLKAFPNNFPINKDTIANFDESYAKKDNLCRNLAIFQKRHSIQGFNSFILTNYLNILSDTLALKRITNHTLLYAIDTSTKVIVNRYNPTQLNARTLCCGKTQLVLLQNYTSDWIVNVNGVRTDTHLFNKAFIMFNIPQGHCDIEIQYKPNAVLVAFYISIISIFIALVTLAILKIRKNVE